MRKQTATDIGPQGTILHSFISFFPCGDFVYE
jgi:hypothetical protein